MRAIVADPGPDLVRLEQVAPPVRGADELLIDVSAVSVNRGELHRLREAAPGWRPGWDFTGTVAAAPGGTGFAPGQRVVGIAASGGSWAEQVAVPADRLAALPACVDHDVAAALPVAALTAQRVLRLAGELADRRVLVTGAAGGVGRFAVQLAAAGGAHVTAVVRDVARASGLAELGAHRIVTEPGGAFDVVLESVGGESLERALAVVGRGGLVVSFGNSARQPVTLPLSRFYPKQATLRGYHLLEDLAAHPPNQDLADLVDLVSRGRLRVDLDAVREITELAGVLRALAARRVAGKAVLRMRSPSRAGAPASGSTQPTTRRSLSG